MIDMNFSEALAYIRDGVGNGVKLPHWERMYLHMIEGHPENVFLRMPVIINSGYAHKKHVVQMYDTEIIHDGETIDYNLKPLVGRWGAESLTERTDWERADVVRIEDSVAQKPVVQYREPSDAATPLALMTRARCLDMAGACVCGDRMQEYGDLEDNFAVIRDLWNTYAGTELSAADVAVMMALLKIARIRANGQHYDSYVDLAGYAACAAELAAEKAKGNESDGEKTEGQ